MQFVNSAKSHTISMKQNKYPDLGIRIMTYALIAERQMESVWNGNTETGK